MARLVARSTHGLLRQLLGSRAAPLEAGQQLSATTAVLQQGGAGAAPLQHCWLHSATAGSAHSYHGGRDDDTAADELDSSSTSSTSSRSRGRSSRMRRERAAAAGGPGAKQQDTPQMRALQAAIERASEAVQASQQAREAAQLPEAVARHAMRDPLGMLISSQGVPLGISVKLDPFAWQRQRQQQQQHGISDYEEQQQDWRELLRDEEPGTSANSSASSSSSSLTDDEQHTSVPHTDAQLLRQKLMRVTSRLVKAAGAASAAKQQPAAARSSSSSQREQQQQQDDQQQRQQPGAEDQAGSSEQLSQLASADSDSWGTTQQSPAEIAQHIADSNRRAGGGSDDDGGGDGSNGDDADDEPLTLSAAEARYTDQADVDADVKQLDEIFEVLAKVPWLDDADVDERELRGVVAVGLLGSLEEVGWALRPQLLRLWGGERDADALTQGLGAREAAAVTAILFHMQQLEGEYGPPPAASVAAALAAAGGSGEKGSE